jgi:hypothetical protein
MFSTGGLHVVMTTFRVMQTNVGRLEAAIRWILAGTLFGVSISLNAHVVPSLLAALVALILAATALTRRSVLYSLGWLRAQRRRRASH